MLVLCCANNGKQFWKSNNWLNHFLVDFLDWPREFSQLFYFQLISRLLKKWQILQIFCCNVKWFLNHNRTNFFFFENHRVSIKYLLSLLPLVTINVMSKWIQLLNLDVALGKRGRYMVIGQSNYNGIVQAQKWQQYLFIRLIEKKRCTCGHQLTASIL